MRGGGIKDNGSLLGNCYRKMVFFKQAKRKSVSSSDNFAVFSALGGTGIFFGSL
jgi:hypothetical protein